MIGLLRVVSGNNNAKVSGCYNFGNINGGVQVGGIVGGSRDKIADSFTLSTALINGTAAADLALDGTATTFIGAVAGRLEDGAASRTNGGLCDEKLLKKHGFASGKYYDFNYSVISEDCDKIILDDFPVKTDVIVSGTDKSCRDRFDAYKGSFNLPDIMPDRTLRNFGYLFSLKVGTGKLLVCGFNLKGLDENEPSSEGLARFIIDYMSGEDFAPTNGISLKELKEYMKKCALTPVKERMIHNSGNLTTRRSKARRSGKNRENILSNN